MSTIAERLADARAGAGFATASDAARALGVPVATYISNENGQRPFGRERAQLYARRFGVALDWLLSGRGKPRVAGKTPVMGFVGAGAEVFHDGHEPLDYIDTPFGLGEESEAVEVRGLSMYPAIMDGDVLVYERFYSDPTPLIGKRVVVKLLDGRRLIKVLRRGSSAFAWTLESFNGPPMEDVEIEWAAPIKRVIVR